MISDEDWGDDSQLFDIRTQKARMLAHFVLGIVKPHLVGDRRSHGLVIEDLMKAFRDAGYEVLTDEIRAAAGLPPRGRDGWTHTELAVLEQKRLEMLMSPVARMMPVGEERNLDLKTGPVGGPE
jgi:hypothetical protein